jgi:hypothetical protein
MCYCIYYKILKYLFQLLCIVLQKQMSQPPHYLVPDETLQNSAVKLSITFPWGQHKMIRWSTTDKNGPLITEASLPWEEEGSRTGGFERYLRLRSRTTSSATELLASMMAVIGVRIFLKMASVAAGGIRRVLFVATGIHLGFCQVTVTMIGRD